MPSKVKSLHLASAAAFVLTHADGSRELHVFTESGALAIPRTVVSVYQVGELPRPIPITVGQSGGTFGTVCVSGVGGGGSGAGMVSRG